MVPYERTEIFAMGLSWHCQVCGLVCLPVLLSAGKEAVSVLGFVVRIDISYQKDGKMYLRPKMRMMK